jgi:hypothetical protein
MRSSSDTDDKRSRGVGGHYLPQSVRPPPLWQYHPTTLGEAQLADLHRLVAPVVVEAVSLPAMGGGSSSSSSSSGSDENKAKKAKEASSASSRKHPWVAAVHLPSALLQFIYRGTLIATCSADLPSSRLLSHSPLSIALPPSLPVVLYMLVD